MQNVGASRWTNLQRESVVQQDKFTSTTQRQQVTTHSYNSNVLLLETAGMADVGASLPRRCLPSPPSIPPRQPVPSPSWLSKFSLSLLSCCCHESDREHVRMKQNELMERRRLDRADLSQGHSPSPSVGLHQTSAETPDLTCS